MSIGDQPSSPEEKMHASEADKKGGAIGEDMERVYGGYFGREDVAEDFAESVRNIEGELSDTRPLIVYEIGANTGVVGEKVSEFLEEDEIEHRLIISDINQEAVTDNPNPETAKIFTENKNMRLPDKGSELVIARSVTHYEPSEEGMIQVLDEVNRVLTEDGIFVNQAVSFDNEDEVNMLSGLHEDIVDKDMNVTTSEENWNHHEKVFDNVEVSDVEPPVLAGEEDGFYERYKDTLEEKGISKQETIDRVRKYIKNTPQEKRPHVWLSEELPEDEAYEGGFGWGVPYEIFICENKKEKED